MDLLTFKEALEAGIVSEDALIFSNPSFDNAIIGVDHEGRVIYSYELMVAQFMQDNDCDEMDAIEFIDYNTIRSLPYYGSSAPIILMEEVYNYE